MLLTGVSSHAAELYLLATNRSNLGERAIEVLLKQVANGVGLDADSLNLNGLRRTRRTFQTVWWPPWRAVMIPKNGRRFIVLVLPLFSFFSWLEP
jgi:hypothetical protein